MPEQAAFPDGVSPEGSCVTVAPISCSHHPASVVADPRRGSRAASSTTVAMLPGPQRASSRCTWMSERASSLPLLRCRRTAEGAFLRLCMGQDLLVQVIAQDRDLSLAGDAAGHRVADSGDAPLQAPA